MIIADELSVTQQYTSYHYKRYIFGHSNASNYMYIITACGKDIFSRGVEIFLGGVEIFQEGLKFFREGLRFFREGLRFFREGLRFFW